MIIILLAFAAFVVLLTYSMCVAAGEADRRMRMK